MKRKAQITLFIILGIMLVSLATVIFYVRFKAKTETREAQRVLTEVPTEYKPVTDLVRTCLEQVATDGIIKLGEHGGVINPAKEGFMAMPTDPTGGEAVIPWSNMKPEDAVIYWWHLKDDNSCTENCEFELVPEKKLFLRKSGEFDTSLSIELQLENYINQNLRACLNDFKDIKAETGFNVAELAAPKAKVTLAQEVRIDLNYPIEVTGAEKVKMEEFNGKIDVNIPEIFELAKAIAQKEAESRFLEYHAKNLIATYGDIDSDLPPMYDAEIKFGSTAYWIEQSVLQTLKDILAVYVQQMKIPGTQGYFVYQGDTVRQGTYNNDMTVEVPVSAPGLEVNFMYLPDQKPYFKTNCEGICRPSSASSTLLMLVGFNEYNFVYDVSYPVQVEIRDKDALNNKGYIFQFYLESNVRENEPFGGNMTEVPEGIAYAGSSMLCDPLQIEAGSGPHNMTITDHTGAKLDDVLITFSCGEETCYIGSTNESGQLNATLPVCPIGGIISFMKDGYISYSKYLNTEEAVGGKVDEYLYKIYTKNFTVMRKKLFKSTGQWVFRNIPYYLLADEVAFITIERIGRFGEGDHVGFGQYNRLQKEESTIDIAPGEYEINIQLLYQKELIIPSSKFTIDIIPGFTTKEFEMENITFETFPSGQMAIKFSFSQELLDADSIRFYAIGSDMPEMAEKDRTVEDLQTLGKYEEFGEAYQSFLVPIGD